MCMLNMANIAALYISTDIYDPSKKTASIATRIVYSDSLCPIGLLYINRRILLILHIQLPIPIILDLEPFMDIEVLKIPT